MISKHVAKIQSLIDDNQSLDLELFDYGITNEILKQLVFRNGVRTLALHHNQITTLDGVRFPDCLQVLWLHSNQITSLAGVKFPNGLQQLFLGFNKITSLDGVKFPDGLRKVWLNNNKIGSLIGAKFPDGLQLRLNKNPIEFGIEKAGWTFNGYCYLLTEDEYARYTNIKYRVCRRFIKRLRLNIIKNKLPFPDCGNMILAFM
jgi:Leucine-rich repeat (LRR) protein